MFSCDPTERRCQGDEAAGSFGFPRAVIRRILTRSSVSKSPTLCAFIFRSALCAAALLLTPARSRGEAMLQFFNNSWNTIAQKVPELAEAGYDSIWLPPPTK